MKDASTMSAPKQFVDFKSLPFEEQKKHFLSVAQRALPLWGYPESSTLRLLNITENATYRVEHPDRETIVMRVHRLDYAERDSIATEIDWLNDLGTRSSLKVVRPLPSKDGDFVKTVETPELSERRNVVCFAFAKGKAPRDSHDDNEDIGNLSATLGRFPKWLTMPAFRAAAVLYDKVGLLSAKKDILSDADKTMYRKLGAIAASIHESAKDWAVPPFYRRIEWDWDATFGGDWNNYYGMHYRDLKGVLSARDIRTIDECAALMRGRIDAYGKAPERYGMIHSDLRMANLLQEGDELTVLDFDDCGKGWFMYDLACIVGFMEHRPDLENVMNHIMGGYRAVRPITDEDAREIRTFIMMRRIGLLQAIMYHINNTAAGSGESAELCPEIMAFYAKGTVVLARKYLKDFARVPVAGKSAKERSERGKATVGLEAGKAGALV